MSSKLLEHYTGECFKDLIKKQAIKFHRWMIKNDTVENAERFANFSDDDMYLEFLNELDNDNK